MYSTRRPRWPGASCSASFGPLDCGITTASPRRSAGGGSGPRAPRPLQRFGRPARRDDGIALRLQGLAAEGTDLVLVLHQEDRLGASRGRSDDAEDGGQAETGALALLLGGEERLEDPGPDGRVHPVPGI